MSDYSQGPALLAAGLQDAGNKWGQAMDQWAQIQQNGKIADSIVKTNPQLLDSLGMSPEQFGSQSAQSKMAAITGVFQAQGAQQHAALVRQQIADYASQAQERQDIGQWRVAQGARAGQEDTEDTAAGNLMRAVLTYPGQAGSPTGNVGAPAAPGVGATAPGAIPFDTSDAAYRVPGMNFTPPAASAMAGYGAAPGGGAGAPMDMRAAIAGAAGRTPGLGGRSFLKAIQALNAYGGPGGAGASDAPSTSPGPYPGQTMIRGRNGQWQIVQDPNRTMTPQEVRDSKTGELTGYQMGGELRLIQRGPPDASAVDQRTAAAEKSRMDAFEQFHKVLDPVQERIEGYQNTMSSATATPDMKARAQKNLPGLLSQREDLLKNRPQLSGASARVSGGGDSGPAADTSGKILVTKGGKQFKLPKEQWGAAQKAGYELAK